MRLEEKGSIVIKMTEGLPFWNAITSGLGVWGIQPCTGAAPTVGGRGDKRSKVTWQWWKGGGEAEVGTEVVVMIDQLCLSKVEAWPMGKIQSCGK